MVWLKISDISSETGIHENTCRRYTKVFSSHFKSREFGKTTKFGGNVVDMIREIKGYYDSGMGTDEIKEHLRGQQPQVLDVVESPQKNHITTLQLQQEVANFTQIVASMGEKMGEQQEDTIRQLMEINHRLDELREIVGAKKKPLFRRLMWWKG